MTTVSVVNAVRIWSVAMTIRPGIGFDLALPEKDCFAFQVV